MGGEHPGAVLLERDEALSTLEAAFGAVVAGRGALHPGFPRPDQGDSRRLWNLAPKIPEERRFTRSSAAARS